MRMLAAVAIAGLCVAPARGAQLREPAAIRLIDQRGSAFTLQSLRGRPLVVTFVATRCTDACPLAEAIFHAMLERHVAARLLTITLDPAYDTPAVMARHARTIGARAPAWRAASGTVGSVTAVLDAFGVERRSFDAHATLVYLIDARGRLRAVVPLSTKTPDEVAQRLRSAS